MYFFVVLGVDYALSITDVCVMYVSKFSYTCIGSRLEFSLVCSRVYRFDYVV